MGKKYTTDEIEVGGHMLDASMMTSLSTVVTDSTNYMTTLPSHNHDYVSEGGTNFNGVYPMVVRVSADNIYSHPNVTFTGSSSQMFVGGSIKSPIFYDSNDTGYYLNPASTSNLNSVTASQFTGPLTGTASNADLLDGLNSGQNGVNVVLRTASNGYLYINDWIHPANGTGLFYDAGVHFHETGNYMYSNTSLQAANDMRAPIFYDRDNTGYYVNPAGTSNINELNVAAKRTDFSASSGWDAVGFGNATNLHMNGHNQFWIGAGNGTWFTGTANAKTQESGLAGNAGTAHDLLITTMQSTSSYDRGITFGVDTSGAGTDGWRLGKWHSGVNRSSSLLSVDGTIFAKGGYTDEYDYYVNNYSSYHGSGKPAWPGDTNSGWHKPSLVASSAIHIQSGNLGTNSRKPQIQFHQYGYGGPGIEYDGPNKTMTFGELGTSNADRVNTFRFRFDNTDKAIINSDYMYHNSDMRAPIFYDSNNTGYYVNPASTSSLNALTIAGGINMGNNNLTNVNHITINDPGLGEGIEWLGGNGWKIFESNDSNSNGAGNLQFSVGSVHKFRVDTSGHTTSMGSSRAPVFYDSNDTNYYVNPASTSNFNVINATGGTSTEWNTAYDWGNHASAGYVTSSGNTIIGTDSDINTSGAIVVDQLNMTDGVIQSHSTRTMTLGNLGYTGATNANYITNNNQLSNGAGYITDGNTNWNNTYGFVTSSGNTVIGTDADINTSGAAVVDQLNMTDGVITSHSTRNLTLGDLGYTGATNANYITNNTQISNGAGYLISSNDRNYITDSRGSQRAPSYYNDRYAQWDFQNSADTLAGGDSWHGLLTVAKWSNYNVSHRQEQLIFTGNDLKRRTASSDSAWGSVKTIYDSGNLSLSTLGYTGATNANYITNNNQLTNGAGYITDGNTNWNNTYGFVTSSGNTIIGTDADINTSGATIIDNLYMTDGVITSHGTRVLTLANLGYTGATNANYITNNNQLTNGAGYLTTSGKAADSNLLDGIDSASFLRSDANDSFSGTLVGSAQRMMEPNDYGKGVYGKYSSTRFQQVWGMGSSWHLASNGTSLGNFYGIAYTHTNVGAGSQSGFSHQTLFVENGVPRTWIGQGVRTVGDLISDTAVKAPIFYDLNNTAYQLDPTGTSRVIRIQSDYIGAGIGANTSGSYRLNMGGNANMNNNGIDYLSQIHFNDNVRFYEDGNDSYLNFKYGDASTGGIIFRNGGGTVKGYVYANAESFGLLDASGNWAVKTAIGAAPLTLYSNSNPEFYVFDSYTVSPGSSRAPIFYDSDNTGYYTNPGGASLLYGLQVRGGDLKMYENGTYSSELRFQNNTHHMGIDYQNNETLRFITRSGVTTVPITFQMRAGTITAANFILSSDERKKTKITDLSCDNIDVAWKSFELKSDEGEYRTGVIAQELEQKHPEFVNTDDKGFKSVKYIDLLIAKIAELEARLEKLEGNGCKKCK